ncbi:MAG: glycosyltransferase family 4 protein [Deltaproteobacteria bacterium]|nr:glycosyltransferase family 4 protein [Deltaproteobacteria bacterium]
MSRKVLLLGPKRTAVSGVSTHLNQLLNSPLADAYRLVHFQVGSEGEREGPFDKLQRFLLSPFRLAARIIAVAPDIVHLNTSLDQKAFWRDAVYMLVAKLFGKRVVYQIHGGDLPQQFFGGRPLLTGFLRQLLRWPDAVVLLASLEREAYGRFSRFRTLRVIPNAIELDDHPPNYRKEFRSETIRLGYIGRLAYNKGIVEAIDALGILRKSGYGQVTLTLAGSGPAEESLRARVKLLGLEGYVTFSGELFGQQKKSFWRHTDIFVFPTYQEGLPYAVLESLDSGTPMVTTQAGGIRDVITDGVEGIFVEPRDAAGVAAAIQTLMSDRGRMESMSAACVARAREWYGIDRLARQFSELYGSVLG